MPEYSVGPPPVGDPGIYNAKSYGADGDGVTDDTVAIQAAIAEAQNAGGGVVQLPPGTYAISASLSITADKVSIIGGGFDTVIKPVAAMHSDVIATGLPAAAGDAGFVRNYIGVANLCIDCSNVTAGTNAGGGNAIHFYGARFSQVSNVLVLSCLNWAVLLDGDNAGPGTNFGYNNEVVGLITDLCAGGVLTFNCEANVIRDCIFKYGRAATLSAQPLFGAKGNETHHVDFDSGYNLVTGCVFGKGGTYTQAAILTENGGPCRITGNRFDQVRNACVELRAGNHIFSENTLTSPVSNGGWQAIRVVSNDNVVAGNIIDNTAASMAMTYAVGDNGAARSGNVIIGNVFLAGSAGTAQITAGSTDRYIANAGLNPLGHGVTQPAVPVSGTPYVNNSAYDCMVTVSGGAVTAIAVDGAATGLTSGSFLVPVGKSLTCTYTVLPTWQWYAV